MFLAGGGGRGTPIRGGIYDDIDRLYYKTRLRVCGLNCDVAPRSAKLFITRYIWRASQE